MFYLGKRLSSLVNGLQAQKPQLQEPRHSKLGFFADFQEGNLVENVGGLVPKAMLRLGEEYSYVVGSGAEKISGLEETHMERAKWLVIESLSKSGEEIGMGLFDRARETAVEFLVKSMSQERSAYLSYLIAHDTVGYGPISILMEDKNRIEEIEINSPCGHIGIFHADYGRCGTNLRFAGEEQFRHALNRFIYDTDKELGEDTPIIDAQVADARVHAQIKPFAISGAVASIRLANNKTVGVDYIAKKGTSCFEVLAYIWLAMDAKMNIIIAGAPASGKTTLLSAIFSFIPKLDKTITIEEDINELKIKLEMNNVVGLYGSRGSRITSTREQVLNALRIRPDRIVFGEVRGEETRDLFSGANMGIQFITTMHSNSGGTEVLKKLVVRPMEVEVRALSALDVVLYMRHLGLSKRLLAEAYEYRWMSRAETDAPGIEIDKDDSVDVKRTVTDGRLSEEMLADSKVIEHFSRKKDTPKKLALKELERRAEFLKIVCEGCKNPGEVLEKVQTYGM